MALNPINVVVGGESKRWAIGNQETYEIEAVLEMRCGEKVGFMQACSRVLAANWTMRDLALVLWGGLRRFDKSLTEDAVADLVSISEMIEFRQAFAEWTGSLISENMKKKAVELAQAKPTEG